MTNDITCVVTSCGRFEYLDATLNSFLNKADLIPSKFIIIDNSGDRRVLKYNQKTSPIDFKVILNETNIGQVASIDKAYSLVETPYIFHLEDDWQFYNTGFMSKSLDVLESRPDIVNINLRRRFSGIRGSMHPLDKIDIVTPGGTKYHEYQTGFLGMWHGFSWNPGLRRLSDYKLIGNYKQHVNEEGVGKFYFENGFKSACLEETYCEHIGEISTEIGRNE